jgi:predicted DNA-binding mobile mystery protein A
VKTGSTLRTDGGESGSFHGDHSSKKEEFMKNESRKLVVEQLDKKLRDLKPLMNLVVPERGWLHTIRLSMRMSLRQLAGRLNLAIQSVKEIEDREADGSITLKTLREVAGALEMRLVYALVPNEESIELMIEKKAEQVARSIVLRTSNTMELEDQDVSKERIEKAIRLKSEEILRTMPRYLWD